MKHPIRKRLTYVAFAAARGMLRWLPLRVAQALGRTVGLAAYGLAGATRRLSYAHLRHAFGPRVSPMTCHHVARRTFIHLAKNVLEWFVLDRLSPAQIRRLVEVHGTAHLDRALAQGRGVIALSAHFGNWELLAMTLAAHGYRGGVVARRLRDPRYQQFLWGMRARKGVETWERGSIRDIAHVLKQHRIVGMMPDQDIDSVDNVFVEFFGHPTATPVGPAALALMTGAVLVPCFIVRQGPRFRVQIEEPVTVARTGDRQADLARLTQAWSRVVESYIRRYPDHWVWMHRRWKTKPQTSDLRPQTSVETSDQKPRMRELQPVLSFLLLSVVCSLLSVVGCAKQPKAAAVPDPEELRAMDSFTVAGYASDGSKKWDLEGTGASADGSIVTIQRPNAVGYDVSDVAAVVSRVTHLTASVAHINQQTKRIKLEQDVTIHTSDGLWLTTPIMYWLPDREEMTTDDPVRIETDHFLLRGRQGHGHSQLDTAVLERDIELVLNPSAEEQPGEPVSHVTITCDGPLTFEYAKGLATFERNVHIVDHQGDLYSDTLIAHVNQQTRTITYAEAIGHVRIVQHGNTATGERAVYEPAKTKVTLLGAPSLLIYPDQPQPATLTPPLVGPTPSPMPRVASQPDPLTGE